MSSVVGGDASDAPARQRRIVLPAAVTGLAMAVGLGALRFALSEPPERSVEHLGDLAFAAVFAAPALLAMIGLRRRPSLIAAGGVLGIALALFTTFSGVSLVLLVPSVLYLVGYAKGMKRVGRPLVPSAVTLLVTLALGVGALFILFVHHDPICWAVRSTSSGTIYVRLPVSASEARSGSFYLPLPEGTIESGCSSDTISSLEALASFALVLATVAAGGLGSTPRSTTRRPAAYSPDAGPVS